MANIVNDHFDLLHFTECLVTDSRSFNTVLEIDVKGVFPLKDYPKQPGNPPYSGTLVFYGVMRTKKHSIRYIGNSKLPEGFADPIEEQQEFAPLDEASAIEYSLEGVQENPEAWIDWTIWARSFQFIITDEPDAIEGS